MEEYLHIDMHYRSVIPLDVEILREYQKVLYWNLIWYFTQINLPYEFIVPYADMSLQLELL